MRAVLGARFGAGRGDVPSVPRAEIPKARRVRRAVREADAPALDRVALVVHRPLPYVYLAREILRSARIPCQMFEALPLAAEPYAAALDLVFSFAQDRERTEGVEHYLREKLIGIEEE